VTTTSPEAAAILVQTGSPTSVASVLLTGGSAERSVEQSSSAVGAAVSGVEVVGSGQLRSLSGGGDEAVDTFWPWRTATGDNTGITPHPGGEDADQFWPWTRTGEEGAHLPRPPLPAVSEMPAATVGGVKIAPEEGGVFPLDVGAAPFAVTQIDVSESGAGEPTAPVVAAPTPLHTDLLPATRSELPPQQAEPLPDSIWERLDRTELETMRTPDWWTPCREPSVAEGTVDAVFGCSTADAEGSPLLGLALAAASAALLVPPHAGFSEAPEQRRKHKR
jgi:hypothetical protein